MPTEIITIKASMAVELNEHTKLEPEKPTIDSFFESIKPGSSVGDSQKLI